MLCFLVAAGTPGQGSGRGARKEQEGLRERGGSGGDTGDAALCQPLAFNNSAGARDPAWDPGARSR